MSRAKDGSVQSGSNMTRRDILKGALAVVAAGASTLAGCASRSSCISQIVVSSSQQNIPQLEITEFETTNFDKQFYYDIMHFWEAARLGQDDKPNNLAKHAAEVRDAYETGGLSGKQKERTGLLAYRYTHMVVCSSVRDFPLTPGSTPTLEQLVRLDIAETLSTGDTRESLRKVRRDYISAYKRSSGSIDLTVYEDTRSKVLDRYLLASPYKQATKSVPLPEVLLKGMGGLAGHILPFDDLGYAFKHRNLPMSETDKESKLFKLYQELVQEFEAQMLQFVRNNKDIGNVKKIKDEKKKYHIQINPLGVREWILGYNNDLSSQKLDEGRYVNKIINLAVEDKKYNAPEERKELEELGQRLKTGLSWKEREAAESLYRGYTKDRGKINLAMASAHALAAYLLATDRYDQEVFYSLHQHYNKLMNNARVDKEVKSEAYTKVVLPYYLDELNVLNKRKCDKLLWGALKTAGIAYSAVSIISCAAAGGGGAAVGGGFTIVGGPI